MNANRGGRLALTVLLAVYGFSILRHPADGSIMDNIDLPIHETGHLLFSPFGEFMQFLGGSLFQLMMPAVFVGYFWHRRDKHAASVALWWVAQNFWNISVYVRDARAQDLPLVGGGEHDWAYLLGRLGWLARDQVIGRRVWAFGVVLYIVAVAGGLFAVTGAPSPDENVESAEAVTGSTDGP